MLLNKRGRGLEGQIGQGNRENTLVPTLIRDLADYHIIDASCGAVHSVVSHEQIKPFEEKVGEY